MKSRILLVVGGVGLKKGRILNSQKAMISLAQEINPFLIEANFLKNAPFDLINFIFRYGEKFSDCAEITTIDKKHNELPVSVEVPLMELKRKPFGEVRKAFASVLIPALHEVAEKFTLDRKCIEEYSKQFGFEHTT